MYKKIHNIIDNNITVLQSISVSHTYYITFTYSSKNTRVPLHIPLLYRPSIDRSWMCVWCNRCWNEQDCRMDLLVVLSGALQRAKVFKPLPNKQLSKAVKRPRALSRKTSGWSGNASRLQCEANLAEAQTSGSWVSFILTVKEKRASSEYNQSWNILHITTIGSYSERCHHLSLFCQNAFQLFLICVPRCHLHVQFHSPFGC